VRGGERLGSVDVRVGGRVIKTVPLVASAGVPEAGLAQRTKDYFTRPLTMVLLLLVLGSTLVLARMYVRSREGQRRRRSRGEPEAA
jgi:hypothetical protein